MYKLLLTLRYLRRKLIPVLAALGVAICTAMVIIMLSVTGKVVERFAGLARRYQGDARIWAGPAGIPDYMPLLDRVRQLDEVKSATAVIATFGFAKAGEKSGATPVGIVGIEPTSYAQVLPYGSLLRWKSGELVEEMDWVARGNKLTESERDQLQTDRQVVSDPQFAEYAMTLQVPPTWRKAYGDLPAAVVADNLFGASPMIFASGRPVSLVLLPLTRQGAIIEPVVCRVTPVNEFRVDFRYGDLPGVFVPFDFLQQQLFMDDHEVIDRETGKASGRRSPARASMIVVRACDGVDVAQLEAGLNAAIAATSSDHADRAPRVSTWAQDYEDFLLGMRRERFLLTLSFVVVSIVAFVMIGVVLYMIVLEKTRDIGTLRALGASRAGVASLFLGQGLAIGLVGSVIGLGLGAVVVWRLEDIYRLTTSIGGVADATRSGEDWEWIGGRLDAVEVTWIMLVAIASSVLGALIPAALAARLDPVEALRYE